MKYLKLSEICNPKQWKTLSTEQLLDKGFPVYGANGKIGYYSTYNHELPTIMITCRGATCGSINISEPKSWINGNAMCLDNLSSDVSLKYLAFYLQNYNFNHVISGSAQPQITREGLEKVKVKVYAKELQEKISIQLDKVQKIISESKAILEKYDTLIKSRFIEMFGDNPIENGKWKVEKLGNLGLCKNGMNFSYEDNGFEINCLGVGDFKDNAVISNCEKLPVISLNEKPSEEYLLKDNDIVFVRSNGNKELVGRSVLVHPRVLTTFSGFCIRFRLSTDSINHLFLLQFLKMPNTRKNMAGRGANIQNLNQQILSNLDIPVPQIELQNDFASFVQQIDKSKFAVQKALEKAETLYKSLMQRYFA